MNEYECPNCGDTVQVPMPASKNVDCTSCGAKLEIHPDAEFFDGLWHDRTELSIVSAPAEAA
jgi:predicted RNA-binding Zn-ribbon protein involved in translation (DUF1610 family)